MTLNIEALLGSALPNRFSFRSPNVVQDVFCWRSMRSIGRLKEPHDFGMLIQERPQALARLAIPCQT